MSRFLALVLALVSGCKTDPGANPEEQAEAQPQLRVWPESLEFGALAVGESLADVITLDNLGEADLLLSSLALELGTGAFTLEEPSWDPTLSPGDSHQLEISFSPAEAATYLDNLVIISDAPAKPSFEVALSGEGLAASLLAEPANLVFGTVAIGCSEEESLQLSNVGNLDLQLEEVELSSGDEGFSLAATGTMPMQLEPGASLQLQVAFSPLSESSVLDHLRIVSDDPVSAEQQVALSASGQSHGQVSDSFTVDSGTELDILFAVDTSPSMDDDNEALAAEIASLTRALYDAGIRYQLAAVVADDGCIAGSHTWIDQSFSDAEALASFDEMLAGLGGDNKERAFTLMEAALNEATAGGCNEGLLRDSAWLHLVGVGDEPEQSANAYSYYMSAFQDMASDPSMVVFHGIGGDYPGGCGGGNAAAYTGMYEAVSSSGGYFISICTSDLAGELAAMGEAMFEGSGSPAVPRRYPLSQVPVEQTLTVAIDGETSDGWIYEAEDNAVVFAQDDEPSMFSVLEVSYHLLEDCE